MTSRAVRAGIAGGCAALLLALNGCTSAPMLPPGADVAGMIGGTPLLHWTGSWTDGGSRISLDLQTMGDGDAIGALTISGHTLRLLVTDGRQLVKADTAFWTADGSAHPERYANRWVELSLSAWQNLAPATLAASLGGADGEVTADSSTPPPASVAPSDVPASGQRPSGVPATALHADIHSPRGQTLGTVWLSSTTPTRLLGYSGKHLPATDPVPDKAVPISFTARSGTANDAANAYRAMAAEARRLPKLIPVHMPGKSFDTDAVDLPEHCGQDDCHITVTGHNASTDLQVQATVRVTLSGNNKTAGSCLAHLPIAAPGKTVRSSCRVTDPRISKIWASAGDDSLRLVKWSAIDKVGPSRFFDTGDGTAIAATLSDRATHPSSTPSN